jgi:hypothetical protein
MMNTDRTDAHYPANGARVVGWIDTTTGQRWLDDMPVLWFNDQYDPVTTPRTDDPMIGAEPLRRVVANLRWAVYHPDARRIGGYVFGAYEAALQTVNEALDRYIKELAA